MWYIFTLLMWIVIWTKLRIYGVPPESVKWYCQGFGFMWKAFIIIWVILPNE